MCVRVGVHVCVLGWAFVCVRVDGMCVRVGVHVCVASVLGWTFMCVLGWALMYVVC